MNKKIIWGVGALLLVIFTWAPWLNREKIQAATYSQKASIDGTKASGCTYSGWMIIPLGRYMTSCEIGYIITIWGQRL